MLNPSFYNFLQLDFPTAKASSFQAVAAMERNVAEPIPLAQEAALNVRSKGQDVLREEEDLIEAKS